MNSVFFPHLLRRKIIFFTGQTMLSTVLLLSSTSAFSQSSISEGRKIQDSIAEARTDYAALLYPRLRQFSITHQENVSTSLKAKLDGKEFFNARYQFSRTALSLHVPLIDRPNNTFVGTIGVVHQFFNIREMEDIPSTTQSDNYIPMIDLGMSFTHRDSLFGKPVSFTAAVRGLFDAPMERRQITGLGMVAFQLVQNKYSRLSAGLMLAVDPSSPAPIFPFIVYFHHFKNPGLDLMIDLPYRFAIRKPIKKTSITLLTEMNGTNSFFEFKNAGHDLPEKMTFSTLEIKSGLLFEYNFTRKAVLSISGGISTSAKANILEQGANPHDYLIENKVGPTPYGQVGLSILPFWRPFKRN